MFSNKLFTLKLVSKNYLDIDIFSFAIITCKHIRSNTLTYGERVSMYVCVYYKKGLFYGVCVCWGGGGEF